MRGLTKCWRGSQNFGWWESLDPAQGILDGERFWIVGPTQTCEVYEISKSSDFMCDF